jgi:hypothetical protein
VFTSERGGPFSVRALQYIVAEAGKLAAEPATKPIKPTERGEPCRALELKPLKETGGGGRLVSAIFALRLEPFWAVRIIA